ncbi:M23 family metallopeptidase [Roseomonas sp. 18066]|uniref:M23 family metallopeptidase n=1 Tax=Roseomonas sp. 18066 TaxID=2681412 RepID=UPI0013585885|nr:M23 family metallopeptidase [Roseomonas sp. 18066]
MALRNALLQPQNFGRPAADAEAALADDLLRLAALLVEDAARGGSLAALLREALQSLAPQLQQALEPRLSAAGSRATTLIAPLRAWIDRMTGAVAAMEADPAAITGLIRQVLRDLRALTDSLTLPKLRTIVGEIRALVEEDLQLGPDRLLQLIGALLDAALARLAAPMAGSTPEQRRRQRLMAAVLTRLRLRLNTVVLPPLDLEPLARLALDRLSRSGLQQALAQLECALDAMEAATEVTDAVIAVLRPTPQPVGAGVVPLQDSANYAWYASWLLADQDLPLYGLGDVKDAGRLLALLQAPTTELARALRAALDPALLPPLDAAGAAAASDRATQLLALAAVNQAMQTIVLLDRRGPQAEFPVLEPGVLSEELRDLRDNHPADGTLLLFNRRVLDVAFPAVFETHSSGAGAWLGQKIGGALAWPRHQVFVSADGRFVLCDDMPLLAGADVTWDQAPIFGAAVAGRLGFACKTISPKVCEIFAQILGTGSEAFKALRHLMQMQPGHKAQNGIAGGVEIAEALQQILFGRPTGAWLLEEGSGARGFGRWLDSAIGPKGLGIFIASFQGRHTAAPFGNALKFWLTVVLTDIVRVAGPGQMAAAGRDVVLDMITLINHEVPSDATKEPANRLKQSGFVGVADLLFGMLLQSLYRRDDYSILLWSREGAGDNRLRALLGYWVLGSALVGIAAGSSATLVAQIAARRFDWALWLETIGFSALKSFGLFWILNYLLKENDTDGGRYRPGGGSFPGYPNKETAASPYLLPYPKDQSLFVIQANLGLFSHNYLSNANLTGGPSAPLQTYAYDFGHDFDAGIACARAGRVWSFVESIADSDESDWNFIIIQHDTVDAVHDDFGIGQRRTYAVYGHLSTNGVTRAFGGTAPGQESLGAGLGAAVTQGQIIALAGDTGMSFHNHLHMHIVADNGAGQPDTSIAIPFVFQDVEGDGVLKSRTWYMSGNG